MTSSQAQPSQHSAEASHIAMGQTSSLGNEGATPTSQCPRPQKYSVSPAITCPSYHVSVTWPSVLQGFPYFSENAKHTLHVSHLAKKEKTLLTQQTDLGPGCQDRWSPGLFAAVLGTVRVRRANTSQVPQGLKMSLSGGMMT